MHLATTTHQKTNTRLVVVIAIAVRHFYWVYAAVNIHAFCITFLHFNNLVHTECIRTNIFAKVIVPKQLRNHIRKTFVHLVTRTEAVTWTTISWWPLPPNILRPFCFQSHQRQPWDKQLHHDISYDFVGVVAPPLLLVSLSFHSLT